MGKNEAKQASGSSFIDLVWSLRLGANFALRGSGLSDTLPGQRCFQSGNICLKIIGLLTSKCSLQMSFCSLQSGLKAIKSILALLLTFWWCIKQVFSSLRRIVCCANARTNVRSNNTVVSLNALHCSLLHNNVMLFIMMHISNLTQLKSTLHYK